MLQKCFAVYVTSPDFQQITTEEEAENFPLRQIAPINLQTFSAFIEK